MDFPFLLIVLLALPLVAAAVIVAVSVARRRGDGLPAAAGEPAHRLQSDSAAVQDATVHAPAARPPAESARVRRAASAEAPEER